MKEPFKLSPRLFGLLCYEFGGPQKLSRMWGISRNTITRWTTEYTPIPLGEWRVMVLLLRHRAAIFLAAADAIEAELDAVGAPKTPKRWNANP